MLLRAKVPSWCIKGSDGYLCMWTFAPIRKLAWQALLLNGRGITIAAAKAAGYKAVKVVVEEQAP